MIAYFPKILIFYSCLFAGLVTCGDLADYLEPRLRITGKDGDDGDDGDRGDTGNSGIPGSDGADGIDGSRGSQGDAGEQGQQGEQGAQGQQGQQGSTLTTHSLAYCVMADTGIYVHRVSSNKFSVYGNDTCVGPSYCFEIKEHRLCWPTNNLQISLDDGVVFIVKYN